MASVRERTAKGGQTTYSVLFRHGGKQASRTFTNKKAAARLAHLVTVLGADRGLAAYAEEEPGRARGVTVDELAEQWFTWKTRDLTPRALGDYRRDYANWIKPFLGHREAASITEMEVQTWVDRDLRPLSAKTVADRHALLHGILAWASARKRALIPHNPCLETDLPKRTPKAPKGLTMPEWLALKESAYSLDQDAADFILFLASTGWRIGEATAVRAIDVEDGDKMYITVSRVQRRGVIVEGAKSAAGLRRIDVSAECARMIRRRVVGLGRNDLIFTNPASPTGLWEPSTFRRRYWSKAVASAGLADRKPTPHWLRHTHVMLCHAAGMSLAEIQRRLGHEDIKTTINVYGRTLGEVDDAVMDRLDALLSGRVAVVQGEVLTPELH